MEVNQRKPALAMPIQDDSFIQLGELIRIDDLETVETQLAAIRQGDVGAAVDQQALGAQGLAKAWVAPASPWKALQKAMASCVSCVG